MFSVPSRHGLSREDAADVAQATFAALVRSLDSLDGDSRLGAWLSTVAHRHTWRLLERNRREDPRELAEDLTESAVLLGEADAASI